MTRRALIVALASLALLGGCSLVGNFLAGTDNSDPPAALTAFDAGVAVQTVWSNKAGAGVKDQFIKLAPRIDNGKVFAADRKGRVSAYAADSGSLLWETQTKAAISGGPGSGAGLVLLGTSEGEVLALDADSGNVNWRAQLSSEILSAPQAESGFVVVRTVDGKLFGLDVANGNRVWVYEQTSPALTLRGTSAPLITNGRVIAGFASGKLAAVSLNEGKLLWETGVAEARGRTELDRLVDISGDLRSEGGIVYVSSFQGRIAAVDLASGNLLWARDMSSAAGIDVDARQIYVTDDAGDVLALDRNDGRTLWRQDKLHARNVTAPAALDSYVVVGDFEGYLHWMSSEDGHFVARIRVDNDGIIAPPKAVGDTVYATGNGGVLTALRPVGK